MISGWPGQQFHLRYEQKPSTRNSVVAAPSFLRQDVIRRVRTSREVNYKQVDSITPIRHSSDNVGCRCWIGELQISTALILHQQCALRVTGFILVEKNIACTFAHKTENWHVSISAASPAFHWWGPPKWWRWKKHHVFARILVLLTLSVLPRQKGKEE